MKNNDFYILLRIYSYNGKGLYFKPEQIPVQKMLREHHIRYQFDQDKCENYIEWKNIEKALKVLSIMWDIKIIQIQ